MHSSNDPKMEIEATPINSKAHLGTVRLHDETTKQIILIPTPSNDPNDPLNWSKAYRYYIAGLSCYAVFLTTFYAAGPAITTVVTAQWFFGPSVADLPDHVARTAFFFTTSALTIGVGNLFWMPLILKFGRRPVYLVSFTCYLLTIIWAALAESYTNELVARIFLGFAAGSGDCLGPLTISDLFFLHERGSLMVWYTVANAGGVALGLITSGLITINHTWKFIYYIAIALVGSLVILLFFTMPETMYVRSTSSTITKKIPGDFEKSDVENAGVEVERTSLEEPPVKHTYSQRHRLYNGIFTQEPFLKLFLRPVFLLALPPVLWATLVFSVALGFYVALTSNAPLSFKTVYGFQTYQVGLCYTASIVGGGIGIAFGGIITDKVANFFTRRNNGIREPEMRLPTLVISIILGPLALMLYAIGMTYKLHWIVPTLGFGTLNFVIVQSTTVSLVYTIDCYRPVAGEVVVTQMAFKAAFGFLLFFYTNPWITQAGYLSAIGTMAAIFGAVMLFMIPLYIWGKKIREATLKWSVMRYAQWDDDRETGE